MIIDVQFARVNANKHRGIHLFRHKYPNEPDMIHFGLTTPGWVIDVYIKRFPLKRGQHNGYSKEPVAEDVSGLGVHQEHYQQTEDRNSAVINLAEATLAKQRHHYARPRQAHAWNESEHHQP